MKTQLPAGLDIEITHVKLKVPEPIENEKLFLRIRAGNKENDIPLEYSNNDKTTYHSTDNSTITDCEKRCPVKVFLMQAELFGKSRFLEKDFLQDQGTLFDLQPQETGGCVTYPRKEQYKLRVSGRIIPPE